MGRWPTQPRHALFDTAGCGCTGDGVSQNKEAPGESGYQVCCNIPTHGTTATAAIEASCWATNTTSATGAFHTPRADTAELTALTARTADGYVVRDEGWACPL